MTTQMRRLGAETFAGGLATGTISEATAAAGVTIDGCLIKDGAAAKLASGGRFLSTEQTGTGSEQTIAHGLAATPSVVIAIPQAGHDGSGGAGTQAPTITYGTHTSTNALVTCTSGAKYRVLAIL